jgi:hypothetical protein
MGQIMASDLFELKKRVDEGTKLGRDLLNEMVPGIKSQIEGLKSAKPS